MSLVAAYIVPHPPLAVHEIGRGEEDRISDTINGFQAVAERIASIEPDTIVIISPHTAFYADWILIAGGKGAQGNFAQFGVPGVTVKLSYDEMFRARLCQLAEDAHVPAGVMEKEARPLDHGVMVPLYYIEKSYPSDKFKAVSVGGSGVPRKQLIEFGRCIARAASESEGKCVLLVSGDLSHKLKANGPYGFDPAGPKFDEAFVNVVRRNDPADFAKLDPRMCEAAAECGLSGFIMMAGALQETTAIERVPFSSDLISHEGPFGVGYGIAAFERQDDMTVTSDGMGALLEAEDDDDVAFASGDGTFQEGVEDAFAVGKEAPVGTDPLVRLAVRAIDSYVRNHHVVKPDKLPDDVPEKAGCFVSIHVASTGELRGCIGTIEPQCASLAEEIVANAISASTRDPRFPAISPAELDDLEVSVDVLFPPEPATLDDMDPKKYGIIVSQGFKRGLLLPDLEGVDTVDEQFRIACMKAGINPLGNAAGIQIERFEVVRHE